MAVLLIGLMATPAAFAVTETDYTIVDPYAAVDWDTWQQYKANLHTHSTYSDGEFVLPEMVEKYYDMGYDILSMTDHGVINYGWNKPHNTFPPFCWANHVEGHALSKKYHKEADMTDAEYLRITTGADRGGRGMVDVPGGIEMNMAVVSKTHVNGFFLEEAAMARAYGGRRTITRARRTARKMTARKATPCSTMSATGSVLPSIPSGRTIRA